MSYGLYDADWQYYKRVPFFNLELMKLSTYYKRRHEIVSLMPTFEPNKYSNVIVRQDYYNSYGYASYDNVTYGGRAFDGENYKPLSLDIEVMKPDIQLYEKIKDKIIKNDNIASGYSIMRRAEHLRLSLDGRTIWSDFEKQMLNEKSSFGLIFYDYDLNAIDGAHEVVQDLLDNFAGTSLGRRIGMKFPVQTDTLNEFDSWASFPPLNQYFAVQYNGLITPNDYDHLIDLRQRSTGFKQCVWDITRGMDYDTFITTGIVQIFETILDLRSHNVNLSLIYDKDFFKDTRWRDITRLICMYDNYIGMKLTKKNMNRIYTDTMFFYCRRLLKGFTIDRMNWDVQKLRDLFQFIRENNYELFVRFYEYKGEAI